MLKEDAQPVRAVVTDAKHVSPQVEPVKFDTKTERRPEESKPNGNAVLLEEQMQKIGDVKGNYELVTNIFQKNMSMLKTALGKNGS